ncbi:hypothetical protein AMS68_001561 [Peltaster fructicola]|uniref:glycogenin glucosyltransferase n=1 Tax=Peltaster fructicola TaxID=286661 RepID=A0A6H0XMU0_9PEZI|nr:hypothetical protein AMS68_001561 [Peltaster fructicola]
MASSEHVYCTLVMNDGYLPGAAVLAHSLRDCGSTRKLACLVTPDTLKQSSLDQLRASPSLASRHRCADHHQSLYNYVIPVERIGNPNPKNLYLMNRADLLYTFTKIQLWRQTQFRKIVYIDADVVALRAPEELFDIADTFAASPDVGWPDIFNTGVMVLSPNEGDFRALSNIAAAGDSFDGADQGLLNQYFEHKPWKRLSFAYNCTPSANYQYEPAYRYFKRDISMVHFIGSTKPWTQARNGGGGANVHQELLSRWWSVYDRHFQVSPFELIEGPTQTKQTSSFQSADIVEPRGADLSSTGYPVGTTMPAPPPEAPAVTTELPLTEKQIQTDKIQLTSGLEAEQRQPFAAPHMEWDATRAPPPLESRPEAATFPSQIYGFNSSKELFHAPTRYPEPPKNMWFEVPAERPKPAEKPAPIFPWEERELPRPSRRFAEDDPAEEAAALAQEEPEADVAVDEFEVQDDYSGISTPTITVTSETSWNAFGATNKNAWDEVSGIDNYVRALTSWQKNRGKVQVVHSSEPQAPQLTDEILETLTDKVNERRESLILTDFPTAIERPSLPVTPAPRRRATFWGEDDPDDSHLPQADGVPHQADWDPSEQLEQLRRNSLVAPQDLQLTAARRIPLRASIASAVPIPEEVLGHETAKPLDETSLKTSIAS